MKIFGVQDNIAHKSLLIHNNQHRFHPKDVRAIEEKLANTKFVDVVIDSHGLAIKEKMTEILYRIQSFSLLMLENAVGINVVGSEQPVYKFIYKNINEAKNVWQNLKGNSISNGLDEYSKAALLLDKQLSSKNRD